MFIAMNSWAVEENKIWYFGNKAGLDFNFDPPKVLTNSQMTASEGCGVACDTSGALMFYTNGLNVWNKNHTMMLEGFLRGHASASQNGVPVSDPGNVNLCYVFTNGAQEGGGNSGFRYSVVDMTMNGGMGGISVFNEVLLEKSSEKIAVAQHSNNIDYWVITHDYLEGKLPAYQITKTGIGSPVISNLGHDFNLNLTWNRAGYMSISRNYSKIALALYYTQTYILYDFDNSTGQISNPIVIEIPGRSEYFYGLEFSPDGSKLYLSRRGPSKSSLYQFDISSNTVDGIINSQVILAENDILDYYCALMLGPDDKIYVASHKNEFLHRINNPNEVGTNCNFVENAVFLDGKMSLKGLPTRAIAVSAKDTTTTPVDTSDVVGLNPRMTFDCQLDSCSDPAKLVDIAYQLKISEDIINSGTSKTLNATIQFNKYLLSPEDPKVINTNVIGELREITFTDDISTHKNYILNGKLRFYAGLGKQASTNIILTNLEINDIVYDVDTLDITNGCFCINICEEGGPRLLNPVGEVNIPIVCPNPVNNNMSVTIELVEKGHTVLFLSNMLGSKVATLFDKTPEQLGKQTVSYNASDLGSGLYYLVLKTPTVTKTTLVKIVK